jgi:anti-anti-sigma factor
MSPLLNLDTTHGKDGRRVLIAAGEIDLSNIEEFEEAIAAAAGAGQAFDVDLSAVEYLDSSAINALYASAPQIGMLVVNPLLVTVLTVSGLSELVAIESAPSVAGR